MAPERILHLLWGLGNNKELVLQEREGMRFQEGDHKEKQDPPRKRPQHKSFKNDSINGNRKKSLARNDQKKNPNSMIPEKSSWWRSEGKGVIVFEILV